jgi:hypothetical protein
MATVITAAQAQDGDVVLAADGQVYQYSGDSVWMQMQIVGFYGPPWQPDGALTLLARNGKSVAS